MVDLLVKYPNAKYVPKRVDKLINGKISKRLETRDCQMELSQS